MNIVEANKRVLSNYAVFSGRATRSEYWWWQLTYVIMLLGAFFLTVNSETMFLLIILFLATIIPTIAVTVRRLHDTDKSGWWYLISFIPYVGSLILIAMCIIKGTEGTNRFGPDPLNPELSDTSVFD